MIKFHLFQIAVYSTLFVTGFSLVFFFFTKIIFKLTIDISMCKIILDVEYFIKSINIDHKGLQRTANEYAEEGRIYKDLISKNEK